MFNKLYVIHWFLLVALADCVKWILTLLFSESIHRGHQGWPSPSCLPQTLSSSGLASPSAFVTGDWEWAWNLPPPSLAFCPSRLLGDNQLQAWLCCLCAALVTSAGSHMQFLEAAFSSPWASSEFPSNSQPFFSQKIKLLFILRTVTVLPSFCACTSASFHEEVGVRPHSLLPHHVSNMEHFFKLYSFRDRTHSFSRSHILLYPTYNTHTLTLTQLLSILGAKSYVSL